jgi:hypothetical protein
MSKLRIYPNALYVPSVAGFIKAVPKRARFARKSLPIYGKKQRKVLMLAPSFSNLQIKKPPELIL